MGKFELTDDDVRMICIAKNTVRRFLNDPQITGQDVIGLGNALYALERLPLVTPGVLSEFGVVYRNGDEDFSSMRYVNFLISDSAFTVSKGGSDFEKEVGSDNFTDLGWEIGLDGYRSTETKLLFDLDDYITEYLDFGAEKIVSDDSRLTLGWSGYFLPRKKRLFLPRSFVVGPRVESSKQLDSAKQKCVSFFEQECLGLSGQLFY